MRDDPHHGRRSNYLRAWREYRLMTQAELAAAVGTEGSVISLLESGERGLSDMWLRRLAPALYTQPGLLLDFPPGSVDDAVLALWRALPRPHADALRAAILEDSGIPRRKRGFGRSTPDAEFPHHDARVDPGFDIPELWSLIPDEDKPAALAALKALIPRH
jgi:transcriptional regulator with XRE-family HTH domain